MIKSEDISKIKEMGYDYITSIGKPSIKKLINSQDSKIEQTLFCENLQEVIENDTRYILRQNPIRRDEIRTTREDKIDSLKKYIEDKTIYYNTHYQAKIQTLQNNIQKKISNLKLSQFISYEVILNDGICIVRDKDNKESKKSKELATVQIIINEEAKSEIEKLDGCYVVTTSLLDITKDTKEDIHKAYKTLIKVENAFKTLKTDFLELRPLYLKTDKRIIGHVALSMIAYNITLKLKEFVDILEFDFKSIIRQLSSIKTVVNIINQAISYETIPTVSDSLQQLFDQMKLKFPNKI